MEHRSCRPSSRTRSIQAAKAGTSKTNWVWTNCAPAATLAASRAVLEVRSREVPFILEDGQFIGRLVYEPMAEPPRALYGAAGLSNYQGQGLKLSKHFVGA